ncbi:MAG TPA: NAD(P)-dependent alcohol dehydrogenase [Stellaceae bacterium]|nr:NAD(P)-dependent alcohol dehydrogenase [Stellaceae bacterium]
MKVIELTGWGLEHVAVGERAEPAAPGPGELTIEMRAASINFRDFVFARGGYGRESGALPIIVLSDGAGRVSAVGPGVSRAAIGDLVCPIVMPQWLAGPMRDEHRKQTLGGTVDGVMAEKMRLREEAVVKAPQGYSAVEAATLPCAALTAWNALVMAGVKQGDLVLTQGTGGVSLFALQFARAMGATVVVTSSSEEKLQRARSLGAQLGINYERTPEWAAELRRLTGGRGADLVVELGGAQSLAQSIRAVRTGGTVALIGVLSGAQAEIELGRVVTRGLRLQAVTLGSRDDFAAMVRFIDQHGIKPVIDPLRFRFDETRAAIATISQGRHFGKLAIAF